MRRLGYLLLFLLALGASLLWLASRDASLQWALDKVAQTSQGKLQFEGVRGSLLGTIHIDRTRFASPELDINATDGSLRLSLLPLLTGALVIDRVDAAVVTLRHSPSDEALRVPKDLTLPLAIRVNALRVKQLSIQSGEVKLLLAQLFGQLSSDGKQHNITLQHLESPWGTASASLSMAGLTPFTLSGTAQLKPAKAAPMPLTSIAVSGNLLQIQASLEAHAAWLAAKAAAKLRPFEPEPVPELTATIERIDLRGIAASLPLAELKGIIHVRMGADKHLTGEIALSNAQAGPLSADQLPLREARSDFSTDFQQLRLSKLDLKLVRGSPLAGDATLSANGLTAQLTTNGLDLSAFHAKLKPTRLSGSLALQFDQTSQQHLAAQLADRRYRYEAEVTRQGDRLAVRKAVVRANNGSITAQGQLELTKTFPFKGVVRLSQLDPSAFGEFPAARLNGTAEASGWIKPVWQTDVKLALSDSSWRGQPLSGQIETSLSQQRLWNSRGNILLGRNQVDFRGALGAPADQFDLAFKLGSLEQIASQWQGSLRGRGHLRGKWRSPSIEFDASGEKLKGPQQVRLNSLQLHAAVAADLAAPLRIDAQIKGAALGDMMSDTLRLQVDGSGRRHQAQLSILGDRLALQAKLNGGLQDIAHWTGSVEQLEITQPHPVKLEAPTTLSVSGNGLDVGAARLTSSGARFDLKQLAIAPGVLRTQGSFTGLPLALLNLLKPDQGNESSLRLSGDWSIDAAHKLNGFLHVRRESGDILIGESGLEAQLTEARLDVAADNNQLHIEGNVAAKRGAYIRARLDTQAAKIGAAWVVPTGAPIALNANANLPYLDWLGPFIHPSLVIRGNARASASSRGTWGAPLLEGRIEAADLSVGEPGSGVRLTKGTLQAHFANDQLMLDAFQIHGKEGLLTATGQASFRGEPNLRLTFQAKQLGLLDRPNWDINADTDGTLTADRQETKLAARIHVNHAKIGIPERGAPTLSQDVVIKGTPGSQPKKGQSRVALEVLVDLGQDFRVRTIERGMTMKQLLPIYQNKLDAKLGGRLQIQSDATGAPNASGKVRVIDGAYTFLGKRLEIKHGTFQFDGPIGNPAMDILAMNEQPQVKVGVSVTGTALNPHAQLVSDPDVPEQEKLSWLLFGRGGQSTDTSLSGSSGISVASFGLQLSDQLYVGYEQGTVGTSSFMTLYSKLTDRLTVEARAGDENALRLFYTFELE